jgi:hypothetical protein
VLLAAGDTLPAAVAGALVPRIQHAGVAGDLCLESEKSSLSSPSWLDEEAVALLVIA